MVGWGGLPNFTEYDAAGQIDLRRAAAGRREQLPRLPRAVERAAERSAGDRRATRSGGATAVYASWNGATTVDAWQLLTGASATRHDARLDDAEERL